MIDLSLTDEQKALQELARDFAQKEIAPMAPEMDRTCKYPFDLLKQAHKLGLLNLTIDEAYGGGGLGWLEACIVGEELSAADAGFATAANANELALTPLHLAATEEQKKKFIAPIARDGGFAAFCVTEPSAGSDVAAMRMRAEKRGAEYILNGTKHFITNGDVAQLYTVFALTDPEKKHRGMSCFAVAADLPGITHQHMGEKMGHRASDTAEIVFDNVRVPAENLIGGEGGGFKIAMETFDRTRVGIGAAGVGIARAAMEASIKFAKERQQFGQAIGNFQAIQFMLADMAIKIETARLAVYHAAWLVDRNLAYAFASAIAKAYGSDVAMQVTTDAVQVHGGYGYYADYKVEKYMRDAKLLQIYEGTNQVQRLVIARALLKD
ncbi:MAG: acyl-CoA dehydrogenase family protein [Anaerolineales bacterium]|nr:acyl-CoA dehydrogenase family protein [Anaerolineales bacterium]